MFYENEYTVVAENLTKMYKLYEKPSDRLKELIFNRPLHKDFFALDGITFQVMRGENLGIIGDNGAGKSTLLKILSKTLSPTRGHFEVKGLTSSLLELGSGLHPEFTGVENIYFYGSLIGIENKEMAKRVPEIIAFSELGDFIHYPIKTYSSGMFVRLAFSIATAVDPDILIIDEALAVGDQKFQKKCIERMDHFRKQRKTVLFCSHDLYQIKMFCNKTIWLDKGKMMRYGESDEVINAYRDNTLTQKGEQSDTQEIEFLKSHDEKTFLVIKDLTVRQSGRDLDVTFVVKVSEPFSGHVGWAILRKDMVQVALMTTEMQGKSPVDFQGTIKISAHIQNLNIVNGSYYIYVGVFDKNALRPIAIDSVESYIETDYYTLNSLCYFDSTFTLIPRPDDRR